MTDPMLEKMFKMLGVFSKRLCLMKLKCGRKWVRKCVIQFLFRQLMMS